VPWSKQLFLKAGYRLIDRALGGGGCPTIRNPALPQSAPAVLAAGDEDILLEELPAGGTPPVIAAEADEQGDDNGLGREDRIF
jgi:hypothetical protein